MFMSRLKCFCNFSLLYAKSITLLSKENVQWSKNSWLKPKNEIIKRIKTENKVFSAIVTKALSSTL